MARSIADIKASITTDFMRNDAVAQKYGFEQGADFYSVFSKVSIESLLFHLFAAAAWVIETLFDQHRKEVEARIEQILPHRPKWYRDKVLGFMKNRPLIADTDRYDLTGMTDQQIAELRVVKHAVATDEADTGVLTIKVAGEQDGKRAKLDAQTEELLGAYIAEIKDAGVRIALVNQDADTFHCAVDIYYDPMLLPEQVQTAAREAIVDYIENLPFNGEYTNMALIDRLQAVEGVRIPELKGAQAGDDPIDARYTPRAGYFTAGSITLNMLV